MLTLIFEEGTSTKGRSTCTPLRIRVSKSAIGSVIIKTRALVLPTGLLDTRNQTIKGKIPEADSTDLKLTIDRTWTPTQHAAMFNPAAEFWSPLCFFNLSFACHCLISGSRNQCFVQTYSSVLKGIPNAFNNSRPSSSVDAVVTNVMFIP